MELWSALISLHPLTSKICLKVKPRSLRRLRCLMFLLIIIHCFASFAFVSLCCSVFAHSFLLQSQMRYERNNTHSLFNHGIFPFFSAKQTQISGGRVRMSNRRLVRVKVSNSVGLLKLTLCSAVLLLHMQIMENYYQYNKYKTNHLVQCFP